MSKKVLIVDDSTFMRMVLRVIVANHNPTVEILEADGENTSLVIIKKDQPNLVLLDIIMNNSEVEGINILKVMQDRYPNVPVLMISSVGHASIIEQCKTLGAKGYIKKPFDSEEIKLELDKYF